MANDPTLASALHLTLLRARHLGGVDLEVARRALHSTESRDRVLARRALAHHQLLQRDEWLEALGDDSPEARRDALEWIARGTSDERVLDGVRASLDDADPLVCEAACFALGELTDLQSVEALCRVVRDHDDPRCREAALGALGALGDERAVPAIIEALNDKAPVRRRAVVALAAFEGPEVDAALERSRDDRDWQVRAAIDQLNPHGVEESD